MQRQLALEVIVTLSETAAAMLRRHTNIVAQASKYFYSFSLSKRFVFLCSVKLTLQVVSGKTMSNSFCWC